MARGLGFLGAGCGVGEKINRGFFGRGGSNGPLKKKGYGSRAQNMSSDFIEKEFQLRVPRRPRENSPSRELNPKP